MKRRVPVELLQQMKTELATQEAPVSAYAKTDDNAFPVFSPVVNKNLLVYIPKTPVVVNADGVEVANPCVSYQHAIKDGNSFANIRCINGLHVDALGYDGDCPLCNAVSECNQLYSKKLSIKAREFHVDIDKDPKNPLLDPVKQDLNNERVVKRAEKFLTFPIVVVTDDMTKPIDVNNIKVYFWDVREQHLIDKLYKMLSSQLPPIDNPYGRFYSFNYIYDTKGAEANKMLAAKNVTYTLIQTNPDLASLINVCEEKAAMFTDIKAAEVIRSVQLWYKEDLDKKVNDIMHGVRNFLAATETVSTMPAANSVTEALANFSMGTAQMPVTQATTVQAVPQMVAQPQTVAQTTVPQMVAPQVTPPQAVPQMVAQPQANPVDSVNMGVPVIGAV